MSLTSAVNWCHKQYLSLFLLLSSQHMNPFQISYLLLVCISRDVEISYSSWCQYRLCAVPCLIVTRDNVFLMTYHLFCCLLRWLFKSNLKFTNLRKKIVLWRKEKGKKKVKCTLVQALKLCTCRTAHRGSGGIALPFHDHGTRKGCGVSASRSSRSLLLGKTRYLSYRRLG